MAVNVRGVLPRPAGRLRRFAAQGGPGAWSSPRRSGACAAARTCSLQTSEHAGPRSAARSGGLGAAARHPLNAVAPGIVPTPSCSAARPGGRDDMVTRAGRRRCAGPAPARRSRRWSPSCSATRPATSPARPCSANRPAPPSSAGTRVWRGRRLGHAGTTRPSTEGAAVDVLVGEGTAAPPRPAARRDGRTPRRWHRRHPRRPPPRSPAARPGSPPGVLPRKATGRAGHSPAQPGHHGAQGVVSAALEQHVVERVLGGQHRRGRGEASPLDPGEPPWRSAPRCAREGVQREQPAGQTLQGRTYLVELPGLLPRDAGPRPFPCSGWWSTSPSAASSRSASRIEGTRHTRSSSTSSRSMSRCPGASRRSTIACRRLSST